MARYMVRSTILLKALERLERPYIGSLIESLGDSGHFYVESSEIPLTRGSLCGERYPHLISLRIVKSRLILLPATQRGV